MSQHAEMYYPDALHPERFVLIGQSHRRRLLYVVHAEVLQDVIRIISARRATAHERRAFAGAGEPGGPSLAALWEMPELGMDAEARAKGMNLHQAMRAALPGWIRRTR